MTIVSFVSYHKLSSMNARLESDSNLAFPTIAYDTIRKYKLYNFQSTSYQNTYLYNIFYTFYLHFLCPNYT